MKPGPKTRVPEFASVRLSRKMRQQVDKMAETERRTLSAMLQILIEEALARRGTIEISQSGQSYARILNTRPA